MAIVTTVLYIWPPEVISAKERARARACMAGGGCKKKNENREKDLLHARDGVVLRRHLDPKPQLIRWCNEIPKSDTFLIFLSQIFLWKIENWTPCVCVCMCACDVAWIASSGGGERNNLIPQHPLPKTNIYEFYALVTVHHERRVKREKPTRCN